MLFTVLCVHPASPPSPSRPVPRVLNLTGNAFSGPFPEFLITQPPLVEASCGGCMVRVGLNGSNMKLEVSLTALMANTMQLGQGWGRTDQ